LLIQMTARTDARNVAVPMNVRTNVTVAERRVL
jgi:hypothetical protein